jgi:choline kinase
LLRARTRPGQRAGKEEFVRAIILSAGQGKRLYPLTAELPKCLLPVRGAEPVLEVQLRALAACGVNEASVLVGFGAQRVEHFLREHPLPGIRVKTVYNPFYATTDNLVTCCWARSEMQGDFILLNGDTLFEIAVLERLLASPPAPLTLAVDHKASYDDDDMKVSVDAQGRLRSVGKALDPATVNGESIGLMFFRDEGPRIFRGALEAAIREPSAQRSWYLSVVNRIAWRTRVATSHITGLWWGELDTPDDLEHVRAAFAPMEAERLEARIPSPPAA